MKKKLFYFMALAAVLSACGEDYEPGEILLGADFTLPEPEVTTRSENTSLQGNYLDTKQNHVGVYIYYKDAKDTSTDGAGYGYLNVGYTPLAIAEGKCDLSAPTRTPYYPASQSQNIDLYAYAPRQTFTSATQTTEPELSTRTAVSFTTLQDQSTDDNYIASDFIWGTLKDQAPKTKSGNSKVEIPMNHKMSKIQVKLVEGHSMASKLAGATVQINNVQPAGTLNLTTGDATVSTATAGKVSVIMGKNLESATDAVAADYVSGGIPTDAATHKVYEAACVIYPQTISKSNLLEITLSSANGSTSYKFTDSGNQQFLAGMIYKYTIQVNATGIDLTTTVQDWNTGENIQGEANYN